MPYVLWKSSGAFGRAAFVAPTATLAEASYPGSCVRDEHHNEAETKRWAALLRAHSGLFNAYMRRVTDDQVELEELIHSAHAIAWLTRDPDIEPSGCRTWILQCCRTARAEWAKFHRLANAPIEPGTELSVQGNDAAEQPAECDRYDVLWESLSALPPRQREVVICRVLLSKSTKETAARMSCKEGTVKAHLHAGLQRLRESCASSLRSSVD
jgi:RNA polymerase sigma factor (sigma-70 family)